MDVNQARRWMEVRQREGFGSQNVLHCCNSSALKLVLLLIPQLNHTSLLTRSVETAGSSLFAAAGIAGLRSGGSATAAAEQRPPKQRERPGRTSPPNYKANCTDSTDPKPSKKPRNHINPNRKTVLPPTPSLQLLPQRKKALIKPSHALRPRRHHHRCYHLHKRPAPVFIDELFKQPVSKGAEHFQPPQTAAASKGTIAKCPPSTARINKLLHQPSSALQGTSKRGGKGNEKTSAADDMWESVGLASPQMHGIDERAEEFITRFRAEMELQEMMARRL
ncbi:hypothetical protein L1049_005152 [Liquidambar formosana]|uniref:DUF761 domain-containing protein n=1 Tax=Liquidambar formosana TaxID=63359 RepID=A0AAP0RQS1_LIQFO